MLTNILNMTLKVFKGTHEISCVDRKSTFPSSCLQAW